MERDSLKFIGKRIKTRVVLLLWFSLLIGCALPANLSSFLKREASDPTITERANDYPFVETAYPQVVTIPAPFTSQMVPYPALGSQLAMLTGTAGINGTQTPLYPGPGELPGISATATQGTIGGDTYPPPGSPVSQSSTPISNYPYPGQNTDAFLTQQAIFSTPSLTMEGFVLEPTASPPASSGLRTPVPPPAWINSQLRASDLSKVDLISGKPQLFFFFAFWDGASLAMAPLVHAVEDIYGEQVNFIYLDIDNPESSTFKDELGYVSQPSLFLIDPQSIILQQWEGYVRIEALIAAIDSTMQ